jgi:hypothetical protein
MTRCSEEESSKWEQLQKNFDTLFSQNELSTVQKQMKAQMDLRDAAMDEYSKEQQTISQQVLANGAAISKMTLKQMEEAAAEDTKPHFDQDPTFDAAEVDSLIFPEQETFQNIFAEIPTMKKEQNLHGLSELTMATLLNKIIRTRPRILLIYQGAETWNKTINISPNMLCQRWCFLISMALILRSG